MLLDTNTYSMSVRPLGPLKNGKKKIKLYKKNFHSICLDMVSIETFGLDSSKNDISSVQKSQQLKKRHLDKSRYGLCPKVSIFNTVSIEAHDLDIFKTLSRRVKTPRLTQT